MMLGLYCTHFRLFWLLVGSAELILVNLSSYFDCFIRIAKLDNFLTLLRYQSGSFEGSEQDDCFRWKNITTGFF
ncbi:hypothetical protein AO730_00760 [Aeromonas veronii]|nr:hypothetical protein AO734_00695 [Aeromonas veronii]KRW45243.1 hypothetical protein AO730_00760 [Aeromonas veronii]KRW49180.1 hypothetical protein AO723_00760 [Aeromonas veronii]KRW55024.1 hypothetical protein AO736_00200 [Aeromonas veronii]